MMTDTLAMLWPQQRELLRANSRYILIDGGVGTGKTSACILRLFKHCLDHPGQIIIVAAQTYQQLKDVFFQEWKRQIPSKVWRYSVQGNVIHMPTLDAELWLRYADHPRAFERIRGSTISGWYITQAETLRDANYLDRLNQSTRLFGKEAADTHDPRYIRLVDMNPGNPSHFMHQRFIWADSESYIGDDRVHHIRTVTTPETSVYSQDRIDEWKRTLPSAEFQRMILGEWCASEGLIFDNWTEGPEYTTADVRSFWIGMDPGTSQVKRNEGNLALVVIADLFNGDYAIVDEKLIKYSGLQSFVSDVHKLVTLWGQEKCQGIVKDWAGGSGTVFEGVLRDKGYNVWKPASAEMKYKEIMYGVVRLYEAFNCGTLLVSKRCAKLRRDLGSYVYGSDGKPDKKVYDSDLIDALRYVWMRVNMFSGWK